MAGKFDYGVAKVRPGTYINIGPRTDTSISVSDRGVVVIPIANPNYGPTDKFIDITVDNAESIKSALGYSVYDDEPTMLPIREALKNATTVKVYQFNGETGSAVAQITKNGLTCKANYAGTRGNDFKVVVSVNALGGYDYKVYLGLNKVEEFIGYTSVADINSSFISITGTPTEVTGSVTLALTGGKNATATNSNLGTFLDKLENIKFNAVAFPISTLSSSEFATIKSKIVEMRENQGKTGQFVVANFDGDYEGIINVTNGVELEDGTVIEPYVATSYVAGVTAGAEYNESNTYKEYIGATNVHGIKSSAEADKAITNGEFFFSISNSGKIVIEYDINSLHSKDAVANKSSAYSKNRVIRVIDTLSDDLQEAFPPGKYTNDSESWDLMEGIGNSLLKEYEADHAIKDVNYEGDFAVDKITSNTDSTYINVSITPLDSAEKIYITVQTN